MSETRNAGAAGRFTFPGTDISVNRMGYGAMQLAGPHVFGEPADPDEARAVLKEAIQLGIDHIDTSDFYGPHVTNRIIREALHPYPGELTIVTKIGARRDATGSWLAAVSPAEQRSAVEDNLRNLGIERIDVANVRVMLDPGTQGPVEGSIAEQLAPMVEMQREGLVRHLGLSNVTARQVEEGRSMAEIVCVQNMYNLANRGDDAMVDALAEDGIAYVPFFPLGGFSPLQAGELTAVARDAGASEQSVALAWLLHRAPNILVIPGTSKRAHLRANIEAASLTLSPDQLRRLDAIGTKA